MTKHNRDIDHIFSIPCETDFSDNEQVLVFEPQSGAGEKSTLSACNTLRKFYSLDAKDKKEFLRLSESFFSKHY
jgi:hypothetical protein